MTKSNNEWVPELNTQCWVNWSNDEDSREIITPIYIGKETMVFVDINNKERCCFLNFVLRFLPIKTEAEKRREKMEGLMFHDLYRHSIMVADDCNVVAKDLINEGWIKPKTFTAETVDEIWKKTWPEVNNAEVAECINAYVRGVLGS